MARAPKRTTKHNQKRKRPTRTESDISLRALVLHKKLGGKIEMRARIYVTPSSLGLVYTPGVGGVASYLAEHPEETNRYTARGRTVAVISDGSAVLGLGNIGPEGALPVMEGKALLFKELGGLDAIPIVLATQDTDSIISAIEAIAPSFGAINLEDIASPRCFEIERRLRERLSIPVLHDDQHGSAVAVLAGLINAHKVVGKSLETSRITIIGSGAAGTAIANMLLSHGVGDVVVVDSHGIVSSVRTDLQPHQEELVRRTNSEQRYGGILEAIVGADAVIGVSVAGIIKPEHIRMMAQHPIVFALANPNPEILPKEAREAGAAVVATGRSDFPNQINNALAFPGIFKGALQHNVRTITNDMLLSAAHNLAGTVRQPTARRILPALLDRRVVSAVAKAIQ